MMKADSTNPLLKLLIATAAVGVGAWAFTRIIRNPQSVGRAEDDETKILHELELVGDPLDPDCAQRLKDLVTRLHLVRTRKRVEQMAEFGTPLTPEEETFLMELAHAQTDDSEAGLQRFLAATTRLAHAPLPECGAKRGQQEPTRSRSRTNCPYCEGIGWTLCSGCYGTGRNRFMPGPQYTGHPLADALIAAKYDNTCSGCRGQSQITCIRCHGTGAQGH